MQNPQSALTSPTLLENWDLLTPTEQREYIGIGEALGPCDIWEPHEKNIPQQLAYESEADIIGFGGAAGGGKTDLGIGLALNKHQKIVFYREDTKQLGGIIERLTEILSGRDGYDGKGTWRNAGPRNVHIEFGHLLSMGDELKAQGRARDLIVLEEAPNMMEYMCRFVTGWNRSVDPNQKCQVLLTFNPPTTAEGRWIITYFAPWIDKDYKGKRALPGEIRCFATLPDPQNPGKMKDFEVPDKRWFVMQGNERNYDYNPADYEGDKAVEIIRPRSRTFIPSRVTNNPYLVGTEYMSTLQALPEPLRSQMLKGDFMAGIGDDPWQVIPTAWVDIAMARWKAKVIKEEMMQQGVDVARGGKDNTIIINRHKDHETKGEHWYDEPIVYPGTETPDGPKVAGLVIASTRDGAPINIDEVGVGASPLDFLGQLGQPVYGINGGRRAPGKDSTGKLEFKNHKSWQWWRVRELLDPKANNGIAIAPNEELKKDLCAPKWAIKGMMITVETREEIIKRIGRSPDYGAAFVNAALETPKADYIAGIGVRDGGIGEYNPYENN